MQVHIVGWCTIILDFHDNIYQVDNRSQISTVATVVVETLRLDAV